MKGKLADNKILVLTPKALGKGRAGGEFKLSILMQPESPCGLKDGVEGRDWRQGTSRRLSMLKPRQKLKEAWQKALGRAKWMHSKDTQKVEATELGDGLHVR